MIDKYNSVFIDGIDRTGKNTIVKYVQILSGHRYMAYDRGIFSNMTYARMFNRNVQYDVEQYRPFAFVYLTCEEDDWKIRCKMTNEPAIDYSENLHEFDLTYEQFKKDGFKIVKFNTTYETPYAIAKKIIQFIDNLNCCQQ